MIYTKYIFALIWLIVFVSALSYYVYMIWFKSVEFQANLVKYVSRWGLFADYFKHWFNSKLFLWIIRCVCTSVLLISVLLLLLAILAAFGRI